MVKTRILQEYINNALVAEKWESGPRRSWFTSSLDSDILFKISKHPVNGSVETTCHYSKNTSHPCSLKKNLNTRNYMLKCDKYDVHTENTSDPQHYIMLYTHKLSTGISLQPLLLPEKSHIPKELLLKNGSRPEQLIDPGMFQELRSDVRGLPGVYVFHYKNSNELIGNKITGPLPVPPQEMLLKVFLKYSFVASKEDQSSKQNLDNIETKINNNINHVRELPEHEFYPISFPDVFKGTHEINSCKARQKADMSFELSKLLNSLNQQLHYFHSEGNFKVSNGHSIRMCLLPLWFSRQICGILQFQSAKYHGRGDLRGMPCLSIHELNFSKIHFIVFNNDLIGTVLLSTGNVLYFRRINKSFVKNIPQLDLNYRALQFSNYD